MLSMLNTLRRRHAALRAAQAADAGESGFTLIELMVVVLIIAILMAIAIPQFLGAKGGAQDRSAQSNITNTLTNVATIYANTQSYNGITTTMMTAADANFTYSTTLANVVGEVYFSSSANGFGIAVTSANGTVANKKNCWMAFQPATGPGPWYGLDESGASGCVAADLVSATPAAAACTQTAPVWQLGANGVTAYPTTC